MDRVYSASKIANDAFEENFLFIKTENCVKNKERVLFKFDRQLPHNIYFILKIITRKSLDK